MNPRNVLSKFTIQLNKYYTLDIAWVCSKPQQRVTVPDFSQNFDFLYSQVVLYTERNLTDPRSTGNVCEILQGVV